MRIFANGLRTLALATIGFSALLIAPQAANAQFTTFITGGHADIEVASLPFPDGDTLEMAVHDDITDAEYDPASTLFVIADSALTTRNAEGQSGTAFDFLGVGVNDPYYLVRPTGNPLDVPIIGVTSEEVDLTEFQDNIVFSLTGYSGPGTFSLYSNASNVFFNAAPGNIISGTLPSTPSSGHTDYFYAFSAPGLYELTIQAQGTLLDGVTQRTASATYFFNAGAVPTVVPEAGTLPLMLGTGCSVLGVVIRRRTKKA